MGRSIHRHTEVGGVWRIGPALGLKPDGFSVIRGRSCRRLLDLYYYCDDNNNELSTTHLTNSTTIF